MAVSLPSGELIERFRRDSEALTAGSPDRLGVAVSGGPDSLALLLLAHGAWPGRVHAATVDHRLRPEAADEARFVARVCEELGVPHSILAAGVDRTEASLQQAARRARYSALAEWSQAEAIPWLATAHHVEDQAETLMMRLLRGSGVGGLAGVRGAGPIPAPGASATLVRPLLGWGRAELAGIVREAGLDPVADPSNSDDRFDRARIRRHLRGADWIDPLPLARSAAALAEAEAALQWAAERLMAERVSSHGSVTMFDPTGVPDELRRRVLRRILGGSPRGAEVGRLLATLAAGGRATLAGVKCSGGPTWRFEPAPPRGLRG